MNNSQRQQQDPDTLILIGVGGSWSILYTLPPFIVERYPAIKLVIVDGKAYHPRQRDHEYFPRLGMKAEVAAASVRERFPEADIAGIPKFVATEDTDRTINVATLISNGAIVLLMVDNFPTKRLVFDHCATLRNVTLLFGGVDGPDACAHVYLRRDGRDLTSSPLLRYAELRDAGPFLVNDHAGCTDAPEEERPNYCALLTATQLLLNALGTVVNLEAAGRLHEFPYTEVWANVDTATAISTVAERRTHE